MYESRKVFNQNLNKINKKSNKLNEVNEVNIQDKPTQIEQNKQIRSKSDSNTKSGIKFAFHNAVKSSIKTNGKNNSNIINISSISQNKNKEELFNSNQNSILLSSPNTSKKNFLAEVLFESSPHHNVSKFQNNPNHKFIGNIININNNHKNKEIFYLSDEDKKFYNKKPNLTDFMSQENELIRTSSPSPKDCFIKNKYKLLLENYIKTSLASNGI